MYSRQQGRANTNTLSFLQKITITWCQSPYLILNWGVHLSKMGGSDITIRLPILERSWSSILLFFFFFNHGTPPPERSAAPLALGPRVFLRGLATFCRGNGTANPFCKQYQVPCPHGSQFNVCARDIPRFLRRTKLELVAGTCYLDSAHVRANSEKKPPFRFPAT